MVQLLEYHKYNHDLTPKMALFIEELIKELGPFPEDILIERWEMFNHKNALTFNCPSILHSEIGKPIVIKLGVKSNKISIAVVIHELLHALGYTHCKNDEFFLEELHTKYQHDHLSKAICRDLYGYDDVLLLFSSPNKETFKYKQVVKGILRNE